MIRQVLKIRGKRFVMVEEAELKRLSQQRLAELAGLRQETLSRLESGKHSPTVRTVEKIDRALKRYAKSKRNRPKSIRTEGK